MSYISLKPILVEEKEGRFFLSSIQDDLPEFASQLKQSLLTSLPGRSVAGLATSRVLDVFDPVDGVEEDLSDIVLRLGKIAFQATDGEPEIVPFDRDGPSVVTAGDVFGERLAEKTSTVLFHVRDGESASIKFFLRSGKGIVVAEDNATLGLPDGFIPCNSFFSPIRRVDVRVVDDPFNNRKGINIHIFTTGSIDPESALRFALDDINVIAVTSAVDATYRKT
jgi:DNA-directed RNA polymerase subunit alpha